jgi:hypothetical protein
MKIRMWLECRGEDGRLGFYETKRVLASPELQKQCVEKRVLKRIIKTVGEHNVEIYDARRKSIRLVRPDKEKTHEQA